MSLEFEMDDASGSSGSIVSLADFLLSLGLSSPTEQETNLATMSLSIAQGAVIRYLRYNPVLSQRIEYYPRMRIGGLIENLTWEANETQAYLRGQTSGSSDELQVQGLPIREFDTNGENPIDLRIDYDGRSGTRGGSFGDGTLKTAGVDFHPNYDFLDSSGYRVCRDGIIRSYGLWPQAPGSVKITYLAGYTATELAGNDSVLDASPIRSAVLDEASRTLNKFYSRMKKATGFGVGPLNSERMGDYSYSASTSLQNEFLSSRFDLMNESMGKLDYFVNWGCEISS